MTEGLRRISILFLTGVLFLCAGCEFRPLSEPGNMNYVRIYVDEHLLNVTTGFYNDQFQHPAHHRPEIMRVVLFDHGSGEMVSERYLRNQGDDQRGHYYDGYILADAGCYDMLAYNFGTESTVVGNEYAFRPMYAYTHEIAPSLRSRLRSRNGSEPEAICYDADHLFVARAEGLELRCHTRIDTLRNLNGDTWFMAQSVVKSYYLQIRVRGAQYLSSASVLLTGMGRQVRLSDGDFISGGDATLYFDTFNGSFTRDGETCDCFYSTFGTFGRLPDADNELTVSFELVTTYGTRLEKTLPMKDVFLREEALVHQWLILDDIIDIPPPPNPPEAGAGGLNPSVEDWNEVDSAIPI